MNALLLLSILAMADTPTSPKASPSGPFQPVEYAVIIEQRETTCHNLPRYNDVPRIYIWEPYEHPELQRQTMTVARGETGCSSLDITVQEDRVLHLSGVSDVPVNGTQFYGRVDYYLSDDGDGSFSGVRVVTNYEPATIDQRATAYRALAPDALIPCATIFDVTVRVNQ